MWSSHGEPAAAAVVQPWFRQLLVNQCPAMPVVQATSHVLMVASRHGRAAGPHRARIPLTSTLVSSTIRRAAQGPAALPCAATLDVPRVP